jgi:hypothetical protein
MPSGYPPLGTGLPELSLKVKYVSLSLSDVGWAIEGLGDRANLLAQSTANCANLSFHTSGGEQCFVLNWLWIFNHLVLSSTGGAAVVVGAGVVVTIRVTGINGAIVVVTGGNVVVTGACVVVTGGNVVVTGAMVVVTGGNVVVTGGIVVTGACVVVTGGNVVVTGGNVVVTGACVVVTGGIVVVTGARVVVTGGMVVVTGACVIGSHLLVLALKLYPGVVLHIFWKLFSRAMRFLDTREILALKHTFDVPSHVPSNNWHEFRIIAILLLSGNSML